MNAHPLPPSSDKAESGRRRVLVLAISSASALLAGLALGYVLGTVHACDRALARGGRHGV